MPPFFVAFGPPFKCHTYSQERPFLLLAATFSHTAPRTHALTQKKEEMCFLLLFSLHAEQEIPSTVTNETGAARGHSEEKKKSRISLSRKYQIPFKYTGCVRSTDEFKFPSFFGACASRTKKVNQNKSCSYLWSFMSK